MSPGYSESNDAKPFSGMVYRHILLSVAANGTVKLLKAFRKNDKSK